MAMKWRKENTSTEEDTTIKIRRRSSSMFYSYTNDDFDIREHFVHTAQDMPPLQLHSKTTTEIVQLLHNEVEQLNRMVTPMSTGVASINVTVRSTCNCTYSKLHTHTHTHTTIVNVHYVHTYRHACTYINTCTLFMHTTHW